MDNGQPMDPDRAMTLYSQGYTDRQIAEHIGCTVARVAEWRNDENLTENLYTRGGTMVNLWDTRPRSRVVKRQPTELEKVAAAAKAAGMDYGDYVAMMEAKK